jgi:hypothetical protein
MSSLSTRPARCRLPTYWPVHRLEGVSFCWATHSNWNNRKREAIRKDRTFRHSLSCSTEEDYR